MMSMMRDSLRALAIATLAVTGCGEDDAPSEPADPGDNAGIEMADIRVLREVRVANRTRTVD